MWTDFYFTNLPKWAFFGGGRPIKRGPPKKEKEKKNFGLCPLQLIRGNHTNTNVHNTSHWMNQYLSGPIVAIQCAILFNIIIIIWKHTNSRPDLTRHWHPPSQVHWAEGRQKFHLHTTGFDPRTLFVVPGSQKGVYSSESCMPHATWPITPGVKMPFWVTLEWLELV